MINGLMGKPGVLRPTADADSAGKAGDYNITLEDIQACRVQEPVDYSLSRTLSRAAFWIRRSRTSASSPPSWRSNASRSLWTALQTTQVRRL